MGDGPTPFTVAVVGGPAFVRHLVVHVVHDAGLDVVDEGPDVTMLLQPDRGGFSDARALGAPIVVLSADGSGTELVVNAVTQGADAVVHTDMEPGRLVHVLSAVMQGSVVLDDASLRAVVAALRSARAASLDERIELTRRERQILESIDRGESVKQTSRALSIASKTVENLQSRLFRKLGVRNRAQAVAVAHELGLLGDERPDPARSSAAVGG